MRIGAAIAHLLKDSLDGAAAQVTPMLTLSPEFRIATVTGWTSDLDKRLPSKRFARSPIAAAMQQQLRDFNAVALRDTPRKEGRMTTLPVHMVDRWQTRSEPGPGQGMVYWHMLMKDHPQVLDLAQQAQQRLARFTGLHMTPLEWLHITTLIAGPSDRFADDQLQQMITIASGLLSGIPPITVMLGDILYHPEAIMLAVKPPRVLTPVYNAVQAATQIVTGERGGDRNARCWIPHITVCYSTSTQRAEPIITALGPRLPACKIHVNAVSLVIQHGPERLCGFPLPAWRDPLKGEEFSDGRGA